VDKSIDEYLTLAPMSEVGLAKVSGVSRPTIRAWRARGLFDGAYYKRGRGIFYRRTPAIRVIKHELVKANRVDVLTKDIYKTVKGE